MELAQALGAFHSSGIEIEITEHQRHKSFCKCFHNFIRTLSSLFSAIADTKPTTYPPIPRPQPVHDFYPRTVHFHAKAEDFHRTHLLFQEKKKKKEMPKLFKKYFNITAGQLYTGTSLRKQHSAFLHR